jgi:hypothetical protein
MAMGYLIVLLCLAVLITVVLIQRDRRQRKPRLRNPKHVRMCELLESGQVFRGTVRLREEDREAVYTVKLSWRRGYYEYAMYKDGQAFELIREKDFRVLLAEIKLGGILQIEELELPY